MNLERVWGSGDLDAAFGGDLATVPWPRAPRGALRRDGLGARVHQLASSPPTLVEIDPRDLWANQPSVVRHHAAYYLTGRWERTGTTSADMAAALNRYPVVVRDPRGRHVIATGHHRSLAALIQGRPLRCRLVDATTPTELPESHPTALTVTPLLLIAPHGSTDAEAVAQRLGDAGSTSEAFAVGSDEIAALALTSLGLQPPQVEDRLTMAHYGRTSSAL